MNISRIWLVASAAVVVSLMMSVAACNTGPTTKEQAKMIEEGKKVALEYTLTLEDGTEVASNVGEDPLTFTQGEGEILPALEEAMTGMAAEDKKKVKLAPEQAYGVVDPEAFREVELKLIPENARVVGALLSTKDQGGNERTVRVHEVKDDRVVLDFNHPLAGQTLNFDLRVVAVDAQ